MTTPATESPAVSVSKSMPKGVEQLAHCGLAPLLGGISVGGLACLKDPEHEAMRPIDFACAQGCGAKLHGPQFFAAVTSCDTCRAKAEKADKLERARTYWEAICPPSFRETDKTHAGFPKAQYEATKDFQGGESLFLFGPSGKGKSRLAMWLLKRCLVNYNQHVAVLWPEQLKAVKTQREILQWVEKWGRYDLLLLDDALLTGAQDERITDALKDLLDYRMRYKRHQIITSQIGGDEYKQQADKFDNITAADLKRVDALLRRLRETFRVVPFSDVRPAEGEASF